MLLLECCHHRRHRCDKTRPLWSLRPKAPFVSQPPRTKGAFGRIVRGLHAIHPHERLQGLAQLEDFPAHGCSFGHPTRMAHREPPHQFAPQRAHPGAERRAGEHLVTNAMPPSKHLAVGGR
jgi:hypothetical protein